MKKFLVKATLAVCGTFAVVYAGLVFINNRNVAPTEQSRVRGSFAAAVDWLSVNRQQILQQNNVALWWMIQRSAEISRNPRLGSLFEEYRARYLERGRNIWRPMFYPGRWVVVESNDAAEFDDYQLHFLYAINCDPELATRPLILAQLDPSYCDAHPFRPACASHQLMGLRFMQRARCGDPRATEDAIRQLQTRVSRQLTWDPRVVDVYLQRVLMLTESGARNALKPVWLDRVLKAQQSDGGWAGIDSMLSLMDGKLSFGFDARGITFRPPVSDFHATAQGLLLMSLLLEGPSETGKSD